MTDIVAARDLAQRLSVDIASTESFAFLVFGQFRFATELDAAGLGARTSFTGARGSDLARTRPGRRARREPAKLRPVGLRAGRHFTEHFFAAGLGELAHLSVNTLAVGADAGIAETVILRVSFVRAHLYYLGCTTGRNIRRTSSRVSGATRIG